MTNFPRIAILILAGVAAGCTSQSVPGNQQTDTATTTSTTTSAEVSSSVPSSGTTDLAGVDPCDLLTPSQRTELAVSNSLGADQAGPTRVGCAFADTQDADGLGLILNTDRGLDGYRSPAADKEISETQLGGFPAVLVKQPSFPGCSISVGVADGQTLTVNQSTGKAVAVSTICDRVTAVAAAALATLTA